MFYRVLALENQNDKNISILSYSPGPMDTNMQIQIRSAPDLHKDTQEYFKSLKNDKKLVDTADSAKKLVKLVAWGKYETGCMIDFYDEVEGM
jgi:NAD(P)-dependent dehydrogenase (short-subunit alcohol dehydrogenase family)